LPAVSLEHQALSASRDLDTNMVSLSSRLASMQSHESELRGLREDLREPVLAALVVQLALGIARAAQVVVEAVPVVMNAFVSIFILSTRFMPRTRHVQTAEVLHLVAVNADRAVVATNEANTAQG
jgi:hypothetical protein